MLAGVSRSSYWSCCALPPTTAHLNPLKQSQLKVCHFFESFKAHRFVLVKIQTSGTPTCPLPEITTSGECEDRIRAIFEHRQDKNYSGNGS
jgi:hypothetical protein